MLDPKNLRDNLDEVESNLSRRGFDLDRNRYLSLENDRRRLQRETETLQAQRNQTAKAIGMAKAKNENADELLSEANRLNQQLDAVKAAFSKVSAELDEFLLEIPNILDATVPDGKSETENVPIRKWGTLPEFNFEPRDHVRLGEGLGLMNFEQAAQLTGSRFVVLTDQLARLHRALGQFMLDWHVGRYGYREAYVPYIVSDRALTGTGQLPKFEEDLFKLISDRQWYLLPTAEVALTNLIRERIMEEDQLPLAWVAHTPCFRSEAGAYGKDTRGMIRQHQFDKVELVHVTTPAHSSETLERLTSHAEAILQALELPYRVVALCAGDIGFSARKTYDLEVWLPGQGRYREISSCSNCGDFQARRMQARFRPKTSKQTSYVHTLNGSGLAVGRTLVAIMENYQQPDGAILVPKALQPYLGNLTKIRAG